MAANPPVPYVPESIEQARARYPEALKQVWSHEAMQAGKGPVRGDRPGLHRQHCFDFEFRGEPTRLIVSVEQMADGQQVLHVSRSTIEPNTLNSFESAQLTLFSWMHLAGVDTPPPVLQTLLSEGGVSHLVLMHE
jgi:hypothetical protein